MTLEQLLAMGVKQLEQAGVPEAGLNAWYLLRACFAGSNCSFERSDYFLRKEEEAGQAVRDRYEALLSKREKRIPLEYITGCTEFMGLSFSVDENVLVPRQDTETLVEYIYPFCKGKRVLDLCTGSGCIGLSIGVFGKPSRIVLSDLSEGALRVAEMNAVHLKKRMADEWNTEVTVVCGDLFEPVTGTFDVIVSNPPYIESDVIPGLMPEVSRFEPPKALDGGDDGLLFYRRIIKEAPGYLNDGGILCFEIGCEQGESVSSLMSERGFEKIEIKKDLAGNDRVVSGYFVSV